MKMMSAIDKKFIQKTRMIKLFVDATKKIIEEEGYEGVTIRKVGDIAGYNSATIYNYFDNQEHLLFFTSLNYLEEYIEDLPNYIQYATNSREIYLLVWQCYIDHAFRNPQIYYRIFFAEQKNNLDKYVEQYYSYYPIDVKKFPPLIREMLHSNSIGKRTHILMKRCVEDGLVDEDKATMIDDLIICIYESMLLKVYRGSIKDSVAKELVNTYITEIFDKMSQ